LNQVGMNRVLQFRILPRQGAMRFLIWLCLAVTLTRIGFCASLSPFAFVMIDSQTEALYGSLPFDRALIAKAVNKLAAANAKGIILKFFYDLPRSEESDRSLELSICAASVVLQACLNDTEGSTNPIEARFRINGKPIPGIPPIFAGSKGFIPLDRFSRCARAVGFVDSTSTKIPLIEVYQGNMVKSLHLIALEMASGQKAELDPSGFVRLGEQEIDLMHQISFPSTDSFSYIPLHEVIGATSKSWQSKVRQSVVILGYLGKNIHSIETPLGQVGAHRFFIMGLLSLTRSLQK
jgi:hypothetical protein